jgi:hypothetical protein
VYGVGEQRGARPAAVPGREQMDVALRSGSPAGSTYEPGPSESVSVPTGVPSTSAIHGRPLATYSSTIATACGRCDHGLPPHCPVRPCDTSHSMAPSNRPTMAGMSAVLPFLISIRGH